MRLKPSSTSAKSTQNSLRVGQLKPLMDYKQIGRSFTINFDAILMKLMT